MESGESPAFGCVTDHRGVISDSMEKGQQQHSWGSVIPPASGEGIWVARIRGFSRWGRWWSHL